MVLARTEVAEEIRHKPCRILQKGQPPTRSMAKAQQNCCTSGQNAIVVLNRKGTTRDTHTSNVGSLQYTQ